MSDDQHRFTNNPRDGQQGKAPQNEEAIAEKDEQSNHQANGGDILNELDIPESSQEELAIAALRKVGIASSWSGLLPRPEDFKEYPSEVQGKMISWNDAQILDESERSNKLVKAEIIQGYLSLILTFVLNVVIVVGVLGAFVTTGNPNVFWAFALPGISVAANVVIHVRNAKKDKEDIN